jgi:uncharacterized protein (TIGR02001 family)
MSSKSQRDKHWRARICAAALLVACAPCAAQGFHGSFGAASDHVWRGISQTRGDPAAQAALNLSSSNGWYAGGWASATVNPSPQHRYATSRYELDLFVGYRTQLSPDWLLDVSLLRYLHPDDPRALDYDYTELTAVLGFAGRVNLTLAVSPDTSMYTSRGLAVDETALATEMSLAQPVFKRLSLTGGIGYYHLGELFSTGYMYWNAGLALDLGRVAIDLTHIQTDQRGRELFGADAADPRTVMSVIVAF